MKHSESCFPPANRIRQMIYRLMIASFLFLHCGNVGGQSVQQLEARRKTMQKDIETTTQLLNETRSSVKHSRNRLNLLSQQVNSRRQLIGVLNQEITLIENKIAASQTELETLQQDLTVARRNYTLSLRKMYTRHSAEYKWLFVLSAKSFSQTVRRMRFLHEYADWQKRQTVQIAKKQEEIAHKQEELIRTRKEKVTLLNVRETENKQLVSEETERKLEYQKLNKKQKDLQKRLAEKQKQVEALNRQIESLISNDIQAGASSSKRKTDAKGGYLMTKEEQELSGSFASNRGQLPFPLSGNYKIVASFGEHQHPEQKRVRLYNNGITIQTTSGTDAKCVFKGVITSVFAVPGYNKGVIVRHGNYLTIYINLSDVYVKTGDKVNARQKLGRIFTDTADDNATILYFEVRKEKEKLDPEEWLN
ncbi:MAG: peptidoglycan DD-metalloendopeptidase family protein [Tannerella sp.]|jgi:septal ring factor EnvC (AmiA/AmiB activator)|nr:peptidoglycan DD-metalloendopeptidase family protein [Tannerella sp.]